ncbi:MAG: molybdenum ABC transporter ATP-binding protein [Desulfobulbus sp.]|jgi:molybdate transport system ATP-binding protein
MYLDVDLAKRLGSFRFQARFTLDEQRVGVFGPSGSGKSTLMLLLAGLLKPDRGHIRLNGTTLYDSAAGINLPPEQRRIGVVFQHAHLFPHLNVRANLLYGWKRTPPAARHIKPETIIEVLQLAPLLDRGVNRLSGGERQRVALARTVLTCPRLILMDEPLSGLDESLKFQIIPYLNRVFAAFAIPLLFISHALVEIQLMTRQVLVFAQGQTTDLIATEELARSTWAASGQSGYANLLHLGKPAPHGDLFRYPWGEAQLILTHEARKEDNIFELDSRDIILFKRHPEATSARNLLPCTVRATHGVGNRVRVELDCGGQQLVAQIVPESLRELGLHPGSQVVAVIKASAFRHLV